ncbi:MAG TPA: hypothetical protein VIH52_01425 [Candidatus Nanoarchaeia archaeon]|nr:hypothetical protein [uncultured archaeon]
MVVKPLRADLVIYLKKHNLVKKFNKQITVFVSNPRHPSLHTEVLEPKSLKIYSFRIDRKYRTIFIFRNNQVEIIDVNDHYQ